MEGWVQCKQVLTASMLTATPRLYPGVADLVRALAVGRARNRLDDQRENIEIVLKAAGLESAFTTVVGKQDVTAVKPDPEGYRLAASKARPCPPRCDRAGGRRRCRPDRGASGRSPPSSRSGIDSLKAIGWGGGCRVRGRPDESAQAPPVACILDSGGRFSESTITQHYSPKGASKEACGYAPEKCVCSDLRKPL